MTEEIYYHGEGIFTRDIGRYPPSMRKLLLEVGNEIITKITLYKYPLVEISALAKFFSNKKIPYDDIFHLGMNINEKYNLDKDGVLSFVRGGIPKKGKPLQPQSGREVKGTVVFFTQTMNVDKVPSQPKLTINALLEQTRLRIGNEKMTEYNAFRNNCQDFIKNLLITGNWSTIETTKFIHQNAESFLKDLPKGTELITKIVKKVEAVVDRLQHGEGERERAKARAERTLSNPDDENYYEEGVEGDLSLSDEDDPFPNDIPNSSTIPFDPNMRDINQDDVAEPHPVPSNIYLGYYTNGDIIQPQALSYGMRTWYGGSGINYAEQKVNAIGNEQRYNFDTPIPDYIQEYSLQNYQIRGGGSGLTYAEARLHPNRQYLFQPIDTVTNPKF